MIHEALVSAQRRFATGPAPQSTAERGGSDACPAAAWRASETVAKSAVLKRPSMTSGSSGARWKAKRALVPPMSPTITG
jgi:hypothetical protein